jgi:FkbM family methyltransferase
MNSKLMPLDIYLSAFTRTMCRLFLSKVRGATLLIEPLRRIYVTKYRKDENASVIIGGIDSTLKMKVNRAAYMGSCIYWRGYHHLSELSLLKNILDPDMVFLDIGANQGEYTLYAAKIFAKGKGQVISFEPVPAMYKILDENISLNTFCDQVLVCKFGLSDKKTTVDIYDSASPSMLHYAHHEGLNTMYPSSARNNKICTIDVKLLDDIIDDFSLKKIDVIKIDVEGSELPILQGALKTIEKYKPKLIIEINEETFVAGGYHKENVLELLNKYGYTFSIIKRNGSIEKIENTKVSDFCNILCTCD